MNKKNFYILLILITAFQYGSAQKIQLGIKGGISLPHLSSSGGSAVSSGYHSISGPDFAFYIDYSLSPSISLETGLEWSTQGGEKSGLQTIPASPELKPYFPPGSNVDFLYANFTSTVRLQYLMLPVLVKNSFQLGSSSHWKLYFEAGIFGALLMNAKATAAGSSRVYFDKEQSQPVGSVIIQFDSTGDIREQLHQGNFGITGNVGAAYALSKFSLIAECGGNYGFINLQKNSQNGVNHTGALFFRLGLYFPLNGKE